jgi:hypothetical protein
MIRALKERIPWLSSASKVVEPAHRPRHGAARQHRRDGAVRRPVGVGHHEQLHRHPNAHTTNPAVVAPAAARLAPRLACSPRSRRS